MKKQMNFGGMAKCIEYNNTKIEKHYRHIFKSDKYVIELLKEFDLINKMKWNKTKMAYYAKDKGLYEFGTPISLLKYKPLTFIEKVRFGISIIKIKLIKDYKNIEKYTAESWLKKNCGNNVYEKIWEPLLITKFGKQKDKISMAWLWGKINLRSSSSTAKGEKLGYLEDLKKIYDDPISHFKEIAKQRSNDEINELVIKNLKTKTIDENSSSKNLGYVILKNIFHELELDIYLNEKQKKFK